MYSLYKDPSGEINLNFARVTESMAKKGAKRSLPTETGTNLAVQSDLPNNNSFVSAMYSTYTYQYTRVHCILNACAHN